jgi:hypothetical protein
LHYQVLAASALLSAHPATIESSEKGIGKVLWGYLTVKSSLIYCATS